MDSNVSHKKKFFFYFKKRYTPSQLINNQFNQNVTIDYTLVHNAREILLLNYPSLEIGIALGVPIILIVLFASICACRIIHNEREDERNIDGWM